MHRRSVICTAAGVFAAIALAGTPALATPCTNLLTLQLEHTTITLAADITTGVFLDLETNKITRLPAFCSITARLTPSADSRGAERHQHRFQRVSGARWQAHYVSRLG